MSRQHLAGFALGVAFIACPTAWAAMPSSANYALPSSTINSGVGDMASANYKASSSLGDPFFAAPLGSANYKINPGFWGAVIGPLPLCLLDIDGDGNADALTDGLMLIRAMFGLIGTSVTINAVTPGAPRADWTAIRGYLNTSCGANYAP